MHYNQQFFYRLFRLTDRQTARLQNIQLHQLTGLIAARRLWLLINKLIKYMFAVQQHLIIDHILLYFIKFIEPRYNYSFKEFADRACAKGSTTLAFGGIGSDQRRKHQFRLRDLKKQLANSNPDNPNPRLIIPSNFCLEACVIVDW